MDVTPGTNASAGGGPPRQPFLEGGEPISFNRGEVIGRRATLCDRLLILDTGYVLLHQPDRDEAEAYLLGPGDPLGEECFQPGAAWRSTATAVTPVRAVAFSGTRIARICRQFPGLSAYVLVRLNRRKRASAMHLAQLRSDSESGRIMGFLQLLGESFGRPTDTPSRKMLPVDEDELPNLLGVSEETLRTTLDEQVEQGLAGRDARRSLWVNVLSSCALALILGARTVSGPALPVMVEGETVLVPVRGRRGRTLKTPDYHKLAILATGPAPWPIVQAG